MIIYKITNTINNKSYVGQTIRNIETRFKEHCKKARCMGLYNAIQKYGKDNFTVEILEVVQSKDLLNEKEQFWVSFYNTISPNGYNLTSGGESGRVLAKETKEKLGNFMKGKVGENHPAYGFKHTDEAKNKISEKRKGIKFSEETKKKMSEASKLRKPNLGKKHSSEAKEKMRKAKLGKPSLIKKEILSIDINNNILEFGSVLDAANQLNISRRSISNALNGWSNSAGGYKFKYKEGVK